MTNDRTQPERPRRTRKRVLLAGFITYSNGLHTLNCSVKDISEDGARIVASGALPFPDQIYLVVINRRSAHQAVVVWRRGQQAGLKFVRSFLVTELPEPSLAYLRRTWADRALR